MADIDRLIHEPGRAMIMAILYAVDSADFLYLQRETGLTKGNLSTHLAKLEEAFYIKIEKSYRRKIPLTMCRLTLKGREAFESYKLHLKNFVKNT